MNWYYADAGKQAGPVDDASLQALVKAGTIKPETLVWREGMPNWAPYSEAAAAFTERVATAPAGSRLSIPRSAVQPATASPGAATTSPTAGGVICSECGGTFPIDQVIQLEGRFVCANCKHTAVQKLKEGVLLPGQMEYAGFWIRVVAKVLDGIILQIVSFVVGLGVGFALRGAGEGSAGVVAYIISLIIGASYNIYFNGKMGATPGKMALKLRIVRSDGSPITYGRAAGRYFAEIISAMVLFIGYIMVGFDEEKRALHDRICDTRVIRQ